jgi:hypothetical protein
MANHWLGIASNFDRVRGSVERTFWCLPAEAQVNDTVLFYFPRAISYPDHGIFAEGIVTSLPSPRRDANPCGGFGLRDRLGPLRYVDVRIAQRFKPPLTAREMKRDQVIGSALFVRRNFQGTTFRLDRSVRERIVELAEAKRRLTASNRTQPDR